MPKKDGKVRIVANFKRTVNTVLSETSDKYQLPDSDILFQEIGLENNFFATLDIKSGYWQFAIKAEDRHKTAFTYDNVTYAFKRLPMGLKNSGDIFCRHITKILGEVKNNKNFKSFVYDLLIHANTFDVYINTLEEIFKICGKYNLRLNPEKCAFLGKSVKFLGRIIDKDGYTGDPENILAVKNLLPPNNKKELQQAIGRFAWLRSFISTNIGEKISESCFSQLIAELTKLNKKDAKFHWPESAQKAFDNAKTRLSSEKCISFANFSLPFTLVTDASSVAMGAVLLQIINGKQKIIACISKTFNETEKRWSATERECYAILFAVEKLNDFLKGPTPFTLLTDHKSLTYLDRNVFSNAKISRWQERLSQYSFICQYIEGSSNTFADMLSRPFLPILKKDPEMPTKVLGEFYKVPESQIRFYIPSWSLGTAVLPKTVLLQKDEQISSKTLLTVVTNKNLSEKSPYPELTEITVKQNEDKILKKIINYVQAGVLPEK